MPATQGEHRFGIRIRSDRQAIEILLLLTEACVMDLNEIVSVAWKCVFEARIDTNPGRIFVPGELVTVLVKQLQDGIDGRPAPPRLHFKDSMFASMSGDA